MSEAKENKEQVVSRRGALAALGAAAVGALATTQDAHADDDTPSRQDIGKVSFEIANYKQASDKFERVANKSNVVSEASTGDTYPTAKSVYEFIKGKENYTQEASDAGKALFVGKDGNTALENYTVDNTLKADSSNPVQSKVLYKEIQELKEAFGLDEKPQKHEDTGSESSKDLKYVCKSDGYVVAYQTAHECPESFSDCEMEYNYTYEGKAITSEKQKWGVRKVDNSYMALCEDEFSGVFLSGDGTTWTAPQAIWHS